MNAWHLHLGWGVASLLGVGSYAMALAGKGRPRWFRNIFYQAAFFTNLVWFVLPFRAQPRWSEAINLQTALDATTGGDWCWESIGQGCAQTSWIAAVWLLQGAGALLILWAAVANIQAMRQNALALHGDVAQPDHLLQSGHYQRVRHPMNAGGMILVLGLALVTQARVSALCWPLYLVIAESFSTLEERLVLRPRFGRAYAAYAQITPRTFTRRQAALLWSIYLLHLTVEIAAP